MNSLKKGLSNSYYYLSNYMNYAFVPKALFRHRLASIMNQLNEDERWLVEKRVNYYNKLPEKTTISKGTKVGEYRFPYRKITYEGRQRRFSTYFFDQYEVMKYFAPELTFLYTHGDVRDIPTEPSFVKSRPINGDNTNAVLLKLNARRHYHFVDDPKMFLEKKDMIVSRTTWCNARPWRRLFCEMFLHHPLCDVGKTRKEQDEDFPESIKPFLEIEQQLDYKFIACIEGIDVATNLKWVMSSNSIAVSPPMKYETWFMEGTLIPDYHYIEIRPDYSDLIEKLQHFISHPNEALAIIEHAHEHVKQFENKKMEQATALSVAQKYFDLTN